jgi:hypothetical protein
VEILIREVFVLVEFNLRRDEKCNSGGLKIVMAIISISVAMCEKAPASSY